MKLMNFLEVNSKKCIEKKFEVRNYLNHHMNLLLLDKNFYEILEYKKELKNSKKVNQFEVQNFKCYQ
jgi:hypothetical protein